MTFIIVDFCVASGSQTHFYKYLNPLNKAYCNSLNGFDVVMRPELLLCLITYYVDMVTGVYSMNVGCVIRSLSGGFQSSLACDFEVSVKLTSRRDFGYVAIQGPLSQRNRFKALPEECLISQ